MSGNEFRFFLSCDINLPVTFRIERLEGHLPSSSPNNNNNNNNIPGLFLIIIYFFDLVNCQTLVICLL